MDLRNKTLKEGTNKKILCLDGGGIRGLFTLEILKYLAIKLYGNYDKYGTNCLISNFDLICGTSTGSIIATSLALGMSIVELIKIYKDIGKNIFDGSYLYIPYRICRYITNGDYYNSKILEEYLCTIYKNTKMLDIKKTKLFITLTDITNDRWGLYLSRSYNLNISQIPGDSNMTIVKTIVGSCAAPTYFKSIVVNDKTFVDGGCICNNPSEVGLLETHDIFDTFPRLVLSIGTGIPTNKKAGYINDLPCKFIDIATNTELVECRVRNFCEDIGINYFRFNPNGIGDISLDESRDYVIENGEIITYNYMRKQDDKINKLKNYLI